MAKHFKAGERVTPKFNFDIYKKNYTYKIINKKADEIFLNVYNLLCEETNRVSNYPCLFADIRFKKL